MLSNVAQWRSIRDIILKIIVRVVLSFSNHQQLDDSFVVKLLVTTQLLCSYVVNTPAHAYMELDIDAMVC